MQMIEEALHFLVPTWWEVEISVVAAVFVIITYWFFTFGNGEIDESQATGEGLIGAGDLIDDNVKVNLVDFTLLGWCLLIFLFWCCIW